MREVGLPRAGNQEIIATGDWIPWVDIVETDKAFVIKAEIPEIYKEDVKVTVDNGVLTIQGERKPKKEESRKKYHQVERHYRRFIRSFTLPGNVDETKLNVFFEDGMLNIQIQKIEEVKPKVIEVKI
jgi:HSP20 family protein